MKPDSGKRKKIEKGEGDGGQLVDRDYNGEKDTGAWPVGIEKARGLLAKMRMAAILPYNGAWETAVSELANQKG